MILLLVFLKNDTLGKHADWNEKILKREYFSTVSTATGLLWGQSKIGSGYPPDIASLTIPATLYNIKENR